MAVLPDVAQKTGAEYFDIGAVFDEGFKNKGYKYMMENYFVTTAACERLNKKYGKDNHTDFDDNCHHNLDGAKHISDIFVEEIKKSNSKIKGYLK